MNISLLPGTKPLEEKVLEGKGRPKILLLDLDGMISFRDEDLGLVKGPSKVAFFREALIKAEEDDNIAGVIIRINSPGGSVAASDTIYHEIMSFRQKKIPTYAYITELAASGGYYVALASDRIIASPASTIGNIGVITMTFNIEGLLSKIGISEETYKSAAKKDFWSPFRRTSPEEQKMLQDIIDKLYGRFLDAVYENRQKVLTREEIRILADGRVMTAGDALQSRLIDEIAYLDEAIRTMKKSLNIDEAKIITYARPRTFKSNIYSEADFRPQVINLLSINTEELSLLSGIRFMYLWKP